ncbi:MAG: hypothetical protein KDA78_17145 [Planctomycetaceae bacterium]|nr:hypothetical protein [Planctomycetaceae bacterium]
MLKSFCVILSAATLLSCTVASAAEYQNETEAWNVGVAFYNARNFAAAQEPFEAALKLTEDKDRKVKIHDALMQSYRLLPESDKFVESAEYVMENAPYEAKRSLTMRSLVGFMYQRGKIKDLEQRYLKNIEDGKHLEISHYLLSEIYSNAIPNPAKSIEHSKEYAKIAKSSGPGMSAQQLGNLGNQQMRNKQFEEAAQSFQQAAELDEKTASWFWKDAASAWSKLNNTEETNKCLAKAEELGPDTRSEQLTYFWHKGLADAYVATKQPESAIPHLEKAIELTKIEGYKKDCEKMLAEARQKAVLIQIEFSGRASFFRELACFIGGRRMVLMNRAEQFDEPGIFPEIKDRIHGTHRLKFRWRLLVNFSKVRLELNDHMLSNQIEIDRIIPVPV